MHTIHSLVVSVLLLALLSFTGCAGSAKPEALKNLCPVTITVMNNGSPVEGVRVSLGSKGPRGAWGCAATTDAQGVAVLQTTMGSHSGKGAPAGEYKLLLSKSVELPADLEVKDEDQNLSDAEATAKAKKRQEFLEKNSPVPLSFEATDSSPLDITVAEKTGAEKTIELSEYKK